MEIYSEGLNGAELTQTFLLCCLCQHISLGDKLLSYAMGFGAVSKGNFRISRAKDQKQIA